MTFGMKERDFLRESEDSKPKAALSKLPSSFRW